MKITVTDLDLPSVWHVVKNMREQDWIEISNLIPRHLCTVDQIAMLIVQQTGVGFVLRVNDCPALVVQLVQKHDGCWSAGLFATDDFVHCWRRAIKEIKEIVIPVLLDHGARYCEAMVMASNKPAQRLLKMIGFRAQSNVLTNYGAFGKDFMLFAITDRGEINNVLVIPENSRGETAD